MIIKPNYFENNGEVDITAYYEGGVCNPRAKGRLSIRKAGNHYEVYVHWHMRRVDEILYRGTLAQCVDFTNNQNGLDDIVEE